jgi:uncharacterized protein YjbI with pentapeptide repeats
MEYNLPVSLPKKAYYRETFPSLSLASETIAGREFEECEFNNCSFVGCTFDGCKFIDCRFTGCRLSAIKPPRSKFVRTKFAQSQVVGFDWTLAAVIEGLEFNECKLNYSNFRHLKLPKLKMEKCETWEAEFIETDLSGGNFTGTDFENSRFFKTNLTGADFRGARNYSISAVNNTLKNAKFSLPEALALLYGLEIIIE